MNRAPICSVILISYKNFHKTTGPCLDSLSHCPEPIEIIVVDNDSGEETQKLLKRAAEKDSRIQLLFLDNNKGYAAGNNIGAQAASSPFLLLLNSDTLVPPRAIQQLTNSLVENPEWDMLGPVTNSSGNDQHIFCDANNPEEILQQGVHWCEQAAQISFQTDRLIFFCVLIRKSLYDELQGLDEDFGLGYFEDTDFVYRARNLNKRLVITEKVFVYHRGRGSFSKVSGAVRTLMKRNKKLFKKKHGHGENSDHWRIKNLQAMERYYEYLNGPIPETRLQYAFANRRQLALTLLPNSPIKRFFYKRKLNAVITKFTKAIKCQSANSNS
jgi:GT2 family glycosyltransferase